MDPCAVFEDSGIPVFIRGVYTCIQIVVRDIPVRKQVEDALSLEKQRMESLLSINQTIKNPKSGIISEIVDDAIRLTGSTIGHLVPLNDDESVMTMQYWSKSAHVSYTVHEKTLIYSVEDNGLWGEAVRQRRPVITNDYAAENTSKREISEGHVPLVRHMNIPVFEGERIVAVVEG